MCTDLICSESIAKRTKSKNRMQITEFSSRLSQHKRVLREITGNVGEVFVSQVFKEHRLLPLKKSSKSSTIPACLSQSCLSHDVTRVLRYLFLSCLLISSNRMNPPPLLLATELYSVTFVGLTLHSTLQDRNNKTSVNSMERKPRDAPEVTPNFSGIHPSLK